MKTLSIISMLVVSLGLSACVKEGKNMSYTDNTKFSVTVLFTDNDGCEVKRFFDGDYRYYVTCPGKKTGTTQWEESCGKSCRESVGVMGSAAEDE